MTNGVVVVGSSNTDLVVTVPHLPRAGETVLGGDLLNAPGGKGANQAVAAARLGAPVTFVACVGDDAFGAAALRHYRHEGIDVRYVRTEGGTASGVALIFVDGAGQNVIAVASGANGRLNKADIEAAAGTIRRARVLLVQLESPLETVRRAVEVAHEAGVIVILNPAPAQPLAEDLLAQVDVLTPNEREAPVVAGLPPTATPKEAADRLRQIGVGAVVVTLGEAGALVAQNHGGALLMPGFAVTAVDTVGAGDAFNGGLAVALSRDLGLPDAARYANAVAAISVTRQGAQPSLPDAAEVEALLASQRSRAI